MGRAGREVNEKRLVGREGLLLSNPTHGLVGHVVHEVVALFGRPLRFHRCGALIKRWVPLVGLAADEPVEILESGATRGPSVERPCRAGLPHRHFMAFAELGCGVAVQFQGPGQRRHGVGQHRGVSRRTRGDLGDAAHAGGVVVAAGQQGLAGRRAKGGGVESVISQPTRCELFRIRRLAGATEGAGRAKPGVIDENQ